MKSRTTTIALAALTLLAAHHAPAQGTIVDGPATFAILPGHFDDSPAASFAGVASPLAQDHVFEEGFWYRVQGDPRETPFPAPTGQAFNGDTATLGWANVDGRGFSVQKVARVTNASGPSGSVRIDLQITNQNPTPLTITLFHLLDVDLAGTAPGDAAALLAAGTHIGFTDGAQAAEYRGLGASALLVRPFGATDVAAELTDAGVDDFDGSGLPFAAGDVTAGFQWAAVTLPPGGQQTYGVVFAVNTAATPVELRGFAVE
jgi:hypothetical protein